MGATALQGHLGGGLIGSYRAMGLQGIGGGLIGATAPQVLGGGGSYRANGSSGVGGGSYRNSGNTGCVWGVLWG